MPLGIGVGWDAEAIWRHCIESAPTILERPEGVSRWMMRMCNQPTVLSSAGTLGGLLPASFVSLGLFEGAREVG
jgi:hypothetical protein